MEGVFVTEAKKIIEDLFKPKPWIYWADFLISCFSGWFLFFLAGLSAGPLFLRVFFCLGSILFLYRAALFVHEIAHRSRKELPGFEIIWNVCFGIPNVFPSFTYAGMHWAHHRKSSYGTKQDWEYIPFATSPTRIIILALLGSLLVPLLSIIRFMILTPLSYFNQKLRQVTIEKFSTLNLNPEPRLALPSEKELRIWNLQEEATFLFGVFMLILYLSGILSWHWFFLWYLMAASVFFLNAIRTLGAHRYRSQWREMSFSDQITDSITVAAHPFLNSLWGPVGLRYHSIHHLFPSLPYHAFPEAHKRFMAQLPEDSLYRKTLSPSLWASLKGLWSAAKMHEAQTNPHEYRTAERH